jgi:hypothetical protein
MSAPSQATTAWGLLWEINALALEANAIHRLAAVGAEGDQELQYTVLDVIEEKAKRLNEALLEIEAGLAPTREAVAIEKALEATAPLRKAHAKKIKRVIEKVVANKRVRRNPRR